MSEMDNENLEYEMNRRFVQIVLDYYKELCKPKNIVKTFNTDDDFMDWLRESNSVSDLTYVLRLFEQDEMYEYCRLIQNVITEKKEQCPTT